jgi:hypothetical protein
MMERNHGALAAALIVICLLAVGVYNCAVNPVTGRSELALVPFSEEEEAAADHPPARSERMKWSGYRAPCSLKRRRPSSP